ncbi:ATP:cob(I)alamin adenosyltransferase, partial [bacterium]|nr:ATP:cob(I)alamin adenosyltransferase [bacterium]
MSIVTGSGDDGKSQMHSGERITKHHPRLEAYGTVDEAQCALGLVRAYVNSTRDEGNTAIQNFDPLLKRVQEDLYIVGADLATPDPNMQVPRVAPEMISLVKQECER